ncbi:lysophospholipid acyltransferase family protein [Sulfurivirga sp.]|uniref:lysophospholipid acyltransferase family protein n=1 Tax=Sulfurivirga sp. TaxID=2614236 RepID=UPI0026010674|nr:lysophospholipid acyltransferase family protein [Sulfurivirga sp.]
MAAEPWKDRLVSPAFIGFVKLMSKLPLRGVQRVGAGIGDLLMLGGEVRRITEINLKQAYPHLSDDERAAMTRAVLRETGKVAAELGPLWLWPPERIMSLVRERHGEELVEAAQAEGRGVLVLGPHIGNWELGGLYLGLRWPTTSMYEPPYFSGVDRFMRQARERAGARVVPTNVRGVKRLLDVLRAGEVVGLLPDQAPDAGHVFADFFGRPARTMTLAHKLVRKTGALAVMGVTLRRADGDGFDVHFLPGPDLDIDDPVEAARRLNAAVERCVALAPAQYQWTYKRWRKPPENLEDIYRKNA